jgi:FMN phosphatase YigB (HAD superfamily)
MGTRVTTARFCLLDVDNTLYDWLAFFGPAMRQLCSRLSELSGCTVPELYDEFRAVFSERGTVEYTFALQELPALQRKHPDLDGHAIYLRYLSAVDEFQRARRKYLRLYPGVEQGIQTLREAGVVLVAVSDAHRYQLVARLKQLRIQQYFAAVCCVPDHPIPEGTDIRVIRRFEESRYSAQVEALLLPSGVRKPSPRVLESVISALNIEPDDAVYVGDSLAKDIAMAKAAGIYDCWAAYGAKFSYVDMETLLRVTHWSTASVAALRKSPQDLGILPSAAAKSFAEVVAVVLTEKAHRRARVPSGLTAVQPSLFELGAGAGTVRAGTSQWLD